MSNAGYKTRPSRAATKSSHLSLMTDLCEAEGFPDFLKVAKSADRETLGLHDRAKQWLVVLLDGEAIEDYRFFFTPLGSSI